jgi:hypothetical protein
MLHKLRPNRDLDQYQAPRRGNHHRRGIRHHGSLLRLRREIHQDTFGPGTEMTTGLPRLELRCRSVFQ